MLKATPTLRRAFACGLALLVLAWVVSLPVPFCEPPKPSGEAEKASNNLKKDCPTIFGVGVTYIGHFIHDNRDEITAGSTAIIAVFTTILGLFTMSLARSTRIAADAAKRSADSDRPHMLPVQFTISGLRGPVGDDGKIKTLIEYRFINYGRSPAFLKKFCSLVYIGSQLPPIPDYGEPTKSNHIIAVNQWFGTSAPAELFVPASDAADILNGRTNYFVFGYIEYDDVASQNHKIRFAYSFVWGPGDASERFRPDGPDTYTEYT